MTRPDLCEYIARELADITASQSADDQVGNYKRWQTRLHEAEVIVDALWRLDA